MTVQEGPDEFVAAVIAELRRRYQSPFDRVEAVGSFPRTRLIVVVDGFGYRDDLFLDEAGHALGAWPQIQDRLAMYRSASRFATEVWAEFEDRMNSATSRKAAGDPDSGGVRWLDE